MKSTIITLSHMPKIQWYEWHDLDELKNQWMVSDCLSQECLVYVPEELSVSIMNFDFESMEWVCNNSRLKVYDVSHWAFVPEPPREYSSNDLSEVAILLDDWNVGENNRKNQCKRLNKRYQQ